MERWCIVDPQGRKLPEPLGDSRADVISCFEALSETRWSWFEDEGYSVGTIEVEN